MTLLGTLALWLALLVGIWGRFAGFVGGLQGRPDLARSARHAVFAMCGRPCSSAVVSLEWALSSTTQRRIRSRPIPSRNLADLLHLVGFVPGKRELLFWRRVVAVRIARRCC